jgi:hypothetical protein
MLAEFRLVDHVVGRLTPSNPLRFPLGRDGGALAVENDKAMFRKARLCEISHRTPPINQG